MRKRDNAPVFLGLATVLLFLSRTYPLPSPVFELVNESWAPGFSLKLPFWHLVFTPLCSVADFLTILSFKEWGVLLAWGLLALLLVRGAARRALLVGGFGLFLAWAMFVPRPMARLEASDPDVLLVNFHSHTEVSHDGRRGNDYEQTWRWHHQQGFGANFITDHNHFEAAQAGIEESRKTWKETGMRSLEGEEVSLRLTHFLTLGNHKLVDHEPWDDDPYKIEAFVKEMRRRGITVVAALPQYWLDHWDKTLGHYMDWGITGFEIYNSDTRVLDFPVDKRRGILEECRKHNLFVTAVSDNHGWGYATAAWNAMALPGWQKLDPDKLEQAILKKLDKDRFDANLPLARAKFIPENVFELLVSPLAEAFVYWRSLQLLQVVSWTVWLWLGYAVFLLAL